MNQIDYQPTAFNPALAFSPQQSQIHSHGGLQQPFLSRNSSVGASQALGQSPYPSQGSPNPQSQHHAGRPFGMASTGFNPNAAMMQQQQQQQHQLPGSSQHQPYTSAPFSRSTVAPAPTAQAPHPQAASPSLRGSPLGVAHHSPQSFAQAQNQAQVQVQRQSPMAAPSALQFHGNPQTPARRQSQPLSPQSQASQAREKERIALLLEINVELLQEMHTLQSQGKGGAQSQEAAALLKKQGLPDKLASEEYIQVLHRLHSNLGYICGSQDHAIKPGSKQPHPPYYVMHPPNMPSLAEKYSRLRELFPGWVGRDAQPTSGSQMNGGGSGGGINFASPPASTPLHG
ncbi:hypothetical protein MBLNU459_g2252t2 [Dothideomycetes sp. NU459]